MRPQDLLSTFSVCCILELLGLHIAQALRDKDRRQSYDGYPVYEEFSAGRKQGQAFEAWPDHWRAWIEEMKTTGDIRGSIRKALKSPEWWAAWEQLPSVTKDTVVKRLMPMLVGNGDWKIPCTDAFKLCERDTNCRWKYWNYVSSCAAGNVLLVPPSWFISDRTKRTRDVSDVRHTPTASSTREKRSNANRRSPRTRKRNKARFARDYSYDYTGGKTKRRHQGRKKPNRRSRRPKYMKQFKFLHNWMGKEWKNIYSAVPYQETVGCSIKCLKALLMLNNSVYSPLLGGCDCQERDSYNVPHRSGSSAANESINMVTERHVSAREKMCVQYQQNAQACRPRLFKGNSTAIGCSESRARCEADRNCSAAQRTFLLRCSHLINGVSCSPACLAAIKELGQRSKHFSGCICDGEEAPICLKIRSNINELCVPPAHKQTIHTATQLAAVVHPTSFATKLTLNKHCVFIMIMILNFVFY
uniref:uncharacterized protein LOC100185778 n=1 Tax=Ciona intestinalis TaxID=7719 RepID=UPI000180D1F8|nr:uncharacterized protein LOC100185778 [Ciona intestinalis]|eukprot:XP_002123239.1 uncharacterized protein LOC100185778 [Ciona intestinalis]